MKTRHIRNISILGIAVLFLLGTAFAGTATAATAEEINIKANAALETFYNEVSSGRSFVEHAEGVLVFPSVVKAGVIVGGEYGEGVLYVGNRPVQYYSVAGGSVGAQLGVENKTIVLVFLEKTALDNFMNSSGWTAGVDGSVALIKVGASGSIDTTTMKKPIVGFVLTNQGLMLDASLTGFKFTKIVR